jgi:choline dehydrogenase
MGNKKQGLKDAATLPFELGRRLFLRLVGAATATAATTVTASTTSGCSSTFSDVEFIVVGSGAGGGPVAANLAREGHKVLLIEAGNDRGQTANYQIPARARAAQEDPAMAWNFFTKHYTDEARQAKNPLAVKVLQPDGTMQPRVFYPRSGTLGGCTAHNASICIVPPDADWNEIAEITGDNTWRAENMRRYFEIIENCSYLPRGTPGHGFDGWMGTARVDPTLHLGDIYGNLGEVLKDGGKIIKACVAAAIAMGQVATPELNPANAAAPGSSQSGTLVNAFKGLFDLLRGDTNNLSPERDQYEGIAPLPLNTRDGRRIGPRDYLIATKAEYPDRLRILTDTLVTRILFDDDKRAIGVEYIDAPHVYRADPNPVRRPEALKKRTLSAPDDLPKLREIIVAGGAFNTPQIRKLSGVGPRQELEDFGIPVVVDLPGVGENLQDRYEISVVNSFDPDPFAVAFACPTGIPDPCLVRWQRDDGPYIAGGNLTCIARRSSPEQALPDVFYQGGLFNFHGFFPGFTKVTAPDRHYWTWLMVKAHTRNRAGTVKLITTNPWDTPEINFKSFDDGSTANGEDGVDLRAMVESVKFARKISGLTSGLIGGGFFEAVPGPSIVTDEQIGEFVKNNTWGHHASCSCKIGADNDPMAVLDTNFNVRGTKGLRVVDASVFPRIPGFFICVAIYMIGEKATEAILNSMGEERKASRTWSWEDADDV